MSEKSGPSLIVHRGQESTGDFVWSPFVNKLEARLRFDNIQYTVGSGTPNKAPRGKIPYIQIQDAKETTEQLADSTFIIHQLIDKGTITDLNARLTPAQKANDLAIRAMLEDKVYFYMVRERWWDHYYAMRDGVLGFLPWPLKAMIGLIAYRGISTTLYGQGTGRYTHEEVSWLKYEVWQSVNALLSEAKWEGDKGPFWILGGKHPTEADATVFGFVASALVCEA